MSRDRAHDEGFTLIELLFVVVILGVVVPALTAAIFIGLRTTDATQNRLISNHDAQLVSVYLPADLQSVGNAAGFVTGDSQCSGMTNLLRLHWTATETLGQPVNYDAAYAIIHVGSEWQLKRFYCVSNVNGGGATTLVVAHNLSGASAGTVSQVGTKVTMTLTSAAITNDPTHYTYTISGIRRTP